MILVTGVGLLGFRDPNGIRPLVYGTKVNMRLPLQFDMFLVYLLLCRKLSESYFAHAVHILALPQAATAEEPATHVLSSESVAIDALGGRLVRDVGPGEAVLIAVDGSVTWHQCTSGKLNPCIFEYVYFARPDRCTCRTPTAHQRVTLAARKRIFTVQAHFDNLR